MGYMSSELPVRYVDQNLDIRLSPSNGPLTSRLLTVDILSSPSDRYHIVKIDFPILLPGNKEIARKIINVTSPRDTQYIAGPGMIYIHKNDPEEKPIPCFTFGGKIGISTSSNPVSLSVNHSSNAPIFENTRYSLEEQIAENYLSYLAELRASSHNQSMEMAELDARRSSEDRYSDFLRYVHNKLKSVPQLNSMDEYRKLFTFVSQQLI
jgi:hypothetical protein